MTRRFDSEELFSEEGRKYDALKLIGNLKSEYDISAVSINVKGSLITSRNITVDTELKLKGRLSANNVHASEIKIHGDVKVSGIDGEPIKIVTGSDCRVDYVHGGDVEIRCGLDSEDMEELLNITGGLLRMFHIDDSVIKNVPKDKKEAVFVCKEISGDEVSLSGVTCGNVSGHNVRLSRNCRVDSVSYSVDFEVDDSCTVGVSKKI